MNEFGHIVENIRRELPARLGGSLQTDQMEAFQTEWLDEIERLNALNMGLKEYFREVLTVTQSLSVNYELSPELRRDLRHLMLEKFTGKEKSDNFEPSDTGTPEPASPNETSRLSDKHFVFYQVLESLSEQCNQRSGHSDVLKRHVYRATGDLKLPLFVRNMVQLWCTNERGGVDFDGLGENEMKAVIDIAYEFCALQFGPADADLMLSTAVRSVENSPQAASFSPRLFL
ncbi:MAG: hypothetical protein AAF402_01545 [Pseudomonadota bacterium]